MVEKELTMDKVIVIGCGVPGYAVIRALANRNIHIIAITNNDKDIAHFSRYVSEVAYIPRPDKDDEQFIALLTRNAHLWEGALILETSDSKAVTLSKNKEMLSRYYRIGTPAWETLKLFIEKEKTYALAEVCNVPFPWSIPLSGLDDIEEIPETRYPSILKPIRSFEFVSVFQVKNFTVNNENELREKFKLCVDAGQSMVLQEIIPGPDENLYKLHGYINSQGQMTGKFFYKKLRQNPPQFGVMRVGISTERNPEVEQLTQKLLNHVNYQGYFNSEFKRDPRDGIFKLIEVNCRMPRGGMLPAAAGVNYPWMIYSDLIMNQQVDIKEYKEGFYWIELYADLSNLIKRRKKENINLRDYLKPYLDKNRVFADLDFHDMKPFMKLTSEKIGNALRRPFRKSGRL